MAAGKDFIRDGLDLYLRVTVSLADALCGYTHLLEHIDGQQLALEVTQPGEIIRPGATRVVIGKGLVSQRSPREKGNLYVIFDVRFPTSFFLDYNDYELLKSLFPKRQSVEPPGSPSHVPKRVFLSDASAERGHHSDTTTGGRSQQRSRRGQDPLFSSFFPPRAGGAFGYGASPFFFPMGGGFGFDASSLFGNNKDRFGCLCPECNCNGDDEVEDEPVTIAYPTEDYEGDEDDDDEEAVDEDDPDYDIDAYIDECYEEMAQEQERRRQRELDRHRGKKDSGRSDQQDGRDEKLRKRRGGGAGGDMDHYSTK